MLRHRTSVKLMWPLVCLCVSMLATATRAPAAGPGAPPALAPETSDVATLPPATPHRFFAMSYRDSIVIYDGDSGNIQGQVPAGHDPTFGMAPDNSRFYVGETLWAHGNRGSRADLLSIYEGKTLNLLKEIALPGRALVGMKFNDFNLSASGKRAYVYNMHPASSIVWVDLVNEAVGGTVEIPGCALVFPWGEAGVSSLCGDGSLATVALPDNAPPKVTHSKPFFDAVNDPIFDNSLFDSTTGRAVFLSYSGLIYDVTLGAAPTISKPWSVNEAAGQKAASTGVDDLAWRPGGRQPIAWHKQSDRLFILMHAGSYWSHNDAAGEIWVLDRKSHTLLARYPLRVKPGSLIKSISVSQSAKPQLYLLGSGGGDTVVDADTGEALHKFDEPIGEASVVANF
jgi:methylamine dehydrogenase heavy chain